MDGSIPDRPSGPPLSSSLTLRRNGKSMAKWGGRPGGFAYFFHKRPEGRNFMVLDSCTNNLPPWPGCRTTRAWRRLMPKVPKPRNLTCDFRCTDRAIVFSTASSHLFRLPGSGFASQFLPQFLNEFCLVHKAASMKCRLLRVKRRRRPPILPPGPSHSRQGKSRKFLPCLSAPPPLRSVRTCPHLP